MTQREFEQMMKDYLQKAIKEQEPKIADMTKYGDMETSKYCDGKRDAYQEIYNLFTSLYVAVK